LWTYIPVGPFADAAAFDRFIAEKCTTADARWLAVIDTKTGLATGILALMRIDPPSSGYRISIRSAGSRGSRRHWRARRYWASVDAVLR